MDILADAFLYKRRDSFKFAADRVTNDAYVLFVPVASLYIPIDPYDRKVVAVA